MKPADINRSANRAFKHYKRHYNDIEALFSITGLDAPLCPTIPAGQLPADLLVLKDQADRSLENLKKHTGNIDELVTIESQQLPMRKPDLCAALINYKKDLDMLFSAIQAVKAKAPKPRRKSAKAKIKKL